MIGAFSRLVIDRFIFNENRKYYQFVVVNRGRRIASSLIGALGTIAVMVGVLCLLVLSFVGSSASVSSSVRSAFGREDVRRAVAEELVDRMQNGDDLGAKIIIRVARDKVVDAITTSLGESNIRSTAGDTAAAAYEVLIEGKSHAVMDIQIFADAAFNAMRSVDPLIPQFLSPQVDPIDLSRDADSPDFSGIRTWTLMTAWGLLVAGLILLTISWFLSNAPRWLKVRRLGIRIFVGGLVLIVLAYAVRSISFGDDSGSRFAEALVSFATGRLILWSFIMAGFGFVVGVLGTIFNRRVISTHTASA